MKMQKRMGGAHAPRFSFAETRRQRRLRRRCPRVCLRQTRGVRPAPRESRKCAGKQQAGISAFDETRRKRTGAPLDLPPAFAFVRKRYPIPAIPTYERLIGGAVRGACFCLRQKQASGGFAARRAPPHYHSAGVINSGKPRRRLPANRITQRIPRNKRRIDRFSC